ncbi:inositol-pentakisphosphate 2-kinase-like isoform X2 [Telopea speciosissima]|uniref:inositol-pentakisphosphate 2-kinase-like isoform X2 n=1 Tax=Telopea speciosissima TaxID=54955 RepID=UPI001CC76B78|nr:inositol-pentakisphosphate 2-kinase-like isoform X2 [Telopea speciosissima]
MEVVLGEKDAADWIYRGEGAVNLVLAYNGSSPDFVGKVMRIQKAPRSRSQCTTDTSVLSMFDCLIWKDTNELVSSTSKEVVGQLFVFYVMRPLLGSEHVDVGMHVLVSRKFLESIENKVRCQRPAWRVDAAKVDTLCDSALLISDHSVFPRGALKESPCISVEIKPKCGFIPCSRFIAEGNAVKRSITRFRMHQVLKLHQGEISQISEYDPLDLFSGSSERIHKAIKALFVTPQNNFRIFRNGSLIFGGLGGGTDNTNFVGSEALEDSIEGLIQADYGLRTASFLQLVSETIFKSGVLDRLLEAQKLDLLDIEGAIHAYYNIVSQPCKVCRDLGDGEFSRIYLSLHSISLEESLKIVRDYLMATTAKDCSLMISFRPRENGDPGSPHSNVCLESTNQSFEYKVYFIDLDMKPLEKMVYYYELDQKIVSCYTQMEKMDNGPSYFANSGGSKTAEIQPDSSDECPQ